MPMISSDPSSVYSLGAYAASAAMVILPSDVMLAGTCAPSALSAATSTASGFGSGRSDGLPGWHVPPPPSALSPDGFSVVAPQPAASNVAAVQSTVSTDRRVRDTSSLLEPQSWSESSESCHLGCAEHRLRMLRTCHHARGHPVINAATRAVHPVWCVAPSPSPVSPSKNSLNVTCSAHSGESVASIRLPSDGRRPSPFGRNRLASRRARSPPAWPSGTTWPDPVGSSTANWPPWNASIVCSAWTSSAFVGNQTGPRQLEL